MSYDLSTENQVLNLEDEYFKFQDLCLKYFDQKMSLKPNLLSTVFDKLAHDKNVLSLVKQAIGDDIYIWSSAFSLKLLVMVKL